jgi:hypothetical protein
MTTIPEGWSLAFRERFGDEPSAHSDEWARWDLIRQGWISASIWLAAAPAAPEGAAIDVALDFAAATESGEGAVNLTCECGRGPKEAVEREDASGVSSWHLADLCSDCLGGADKCPMCLLPNDDCSCNERG